MPSPAVAAVTEGGLTATGTSLPVTLPGSGAATDLFIVIIGKGSGANTINALTDWSELLDENVANGALAVIYYTGAGVPSDPTFTQSATSRSVWGAYRITGASKSIAPQIGTTATGTSATPDPPSVAVTNGPREVLAIACFCVSAADGARGRRHARNDVPDELHGRADREDGRHDGHEPFGDARQCGASGHDRDRGPGHVHSERFPCVAGEHDHRSPRHVVAVGDAPQPRTQATIRR